MEIFVKVDDVKAHYSWWSNKEERKLYLVAARKPISLDVGL